MPEHPVIELGVDEHGNAVHEIPCYPQRHAYLENRVGKFGDLLVDGLQVDGTPSVSAVLASAGSRAYELLCALIPNLAKRIPEYEFRGFGSREAYEDGDYDEAKDRSPSFAQIVAAFETAIKVNRFDVFTALKAVVDPKAIRVRVSEWILDSDGLLSSPGTSGASPQSDSGTTDRTPAPSEPHPDPSVSESPNGSGSLLTTTA